MHPKPILLLALQTMILSKYLVRNRFESIRIIDQVISCSIEVILIENYDENSNLNHSKKTGGQTIGYREPVFCSRAKRFR